MAPLQRIALVPDARGTDNGTARHRTWIRLSPPGLHEIRAQARLFLYQGARTANPRNPSCGASPAKPESRKRRARSGRCLTIRALRATCYRFLFIPLTAIGVHHSGIEPNGIDPSMLCIKMALRL